ncbi:MAG: aromatic acid decarboxylase [Desulfobulbus propionicus]|nr:MAG: aromatic acid decarboxylase [Desulfobulbus propionicus]
MGSDRLLLGITGATGMLYVPSLLNRLATAQVEVEAIISATGRQVLKWELGFTAEELPGVRRWYAVDDFAARPSSGSSRYRGMVILPCTMGSLAAIASGTCLNLIHRAADVTLKERRPLLLAVRETPFNRTHLRNMLTVQDAGGIVMPLMPSFYSQPRGLSEMADDLTMRICDLLDISVTSTRRWQGPDC